MKCIVQYKADDVEWRGLDLNGLDCTDSEDVEPKLYSTFDSAILAMARFFATDIKGGDDFSYRVLDVLNQKVIALFEQP